MRAIPAFAVLILAASLFTVRAHAQDSTHVITSPPMAHAEEGTLRLALGGIGGAFAGAGTGTAIGIVVGAAACRGTERSWCTLAYGLGGAVAGLAVGTPVGVHFANHSRGNLALTTIGSMAATAALLGIGSTLTRGNGPPLVLTIPLEIGTAIQIERYVERHRLRAEY